MATESALFRLLRRLRLILLKHDQVKFVPPIKIPDPCHYDSPNTFSISGTVCLNLRFLLKKHAPRL